jgi:hypothetical protein
MSHHLSGPNLRSPAGDHIDPRTDLLPDLPYLGNPHRRSR